MTDPRIRQTLRLPPELAQAADERAARLGCSRQEVIVSALRALLEGDRVETAVEIVVQDLAARGREDLAAAVAVATDDRSPEARSESAGRLWRELRRRHYG